MKPHAIISWQENNRGKACNHSSEIKQPAHDSHSSTLTNQDVMMHVDLSFLQMKTHLSHS